ncbi:O-antigen ligase family protein [Phyllobacterium sp. P30BS-XVII]|uniref:O-antigen ligase family protein n=1 Tax=Phyllobacterium sp. P30BS-XVII TaxID=2587046 RepID=UPI0015FC7367|nr:O-antigen ligase family protein [Phyllobacterium sp. P30BS-XVII]MBA8901491.1 O-antigen ligase [Phyllobacterium sp. P30BS-XVII]
MFPVQLTNALLLPTKGRLIGIDRNNRIFTFLFALFPGLLVSGTSVTLVCAFLWAIISLSLKRYPYQMTRQDRVIAWIFTTYVLITALTVVLSPNLAKGGEYLLKMIPFLAVWALISRLRVSLQGRLIPFFVTGAGIGMIGALIYSIVQVLFIESRAAGGAGNAAVFGLFAVLFGSISLLNVHSESRTERIIAIAGFTCGIICAFLSGTRSAWLVMPVHCAILFWYLRGQTLPTINKTAKVLMVLLLVVVALAAIPKILDRYRALQIDIVQLDEKPDNMSSLGARIQLWSGAEKAFLASPLIGQGPQNRMRSVNEALELPVEKYMTFTHVHNGFLNAAVDGGVLGILALLLLLSAPIVAARLKEPGPGRDLMTALSLLLVTSYVITGMFGIMFGHDATDAVFIYMTLLISSVSGTMPYLSMREIADRAEDDKAALAA